MVLLPRGHIALCPPECRLLAEACRLVSQRFNGAADEVRMLYADTLATAFDALADAQALAFFVTTEDESEAEQWTNRLIEVAP